MPATLSYPKCSQPNTHWRPPVKAPAVTAIGSLANATAQSRTSAPPRPAPWEESSLEQPIPWSVL